MSCVEYRVGDFVYFESLSSQPYLIRRIDEFIQTSNGNILVKGMSFWRKSDIPDESTSFVTDESHVLERYGKNADFNSLSPEQKNKLKLRELFLSHISDKLNIKQIKGKCSVTLLNEAESLLSYLNKEDSFFYCVVFDPDEKRFSVEKKKNRVGTKYQAAIPACVSKFSKAIKEPCETLMWTPDNGLSDAEIDEFMETTKSLGTLSRLLNCYPPSRESRALECAAAASRDFTMFQAMNTLHENGYCIGSSLGSLYTSGKPALFIDEIEGWCQDEGALFEIALRKVGKNFNRIKKDYFPWRSMKSLVEYYYAWKTTDHYVLMKSNSTTRKLTSVRVTEMNSQLSREDEGEKPEERTSMTVCESCRKLCSKSGVQLWDPTALKNVYFCKECWNYWKRYGGL